MDRKEQVRKRQKEEEEEEEEHSILDLLKKICIWSKCCEGKHMAVERPEK